MDNKKILFISYHYPPVGGKGLPGSQRSVKFIRYLPFKEKYVLTLKENLYPEFFSLENKTNLPINNEVITRTGTFDIFKLLLKIKNAFKGGGCGRDNSIQSANSKNVQVEKTYPDKKGLFGKVKDIVSGILTFPDYASPWIIPAVRQGRTLVKENSIDIIFATGSPWSSLIVGWLIKFFTGARLVVDFRDPWVDNPFHYKNRLKKITEDYLEKKIVRSADIVTLNTEELRENFQGRYNFVPPDKFVVLFNGYDEYDFRDIKTEKIDAPADCLLLTHAGFLYGIRDPKAIFSAIEKVIEKNAEIGKNVKFCQIGNIELDYDINKLLAERSLQSNYIHIRQLEYSKCINYMSASDILTIIQPETKTQIPSKIFEYIFLKKPILAITPVDGALGRLMRKYNFGNVFEPDDINGMADYIVRQYSFKKKHGLSEIDYKNAFMFDVKNISNKLYETIVRLPSF